MQRQWLKGAMWWVGGATATTNGGQEPSIYQGRVLVRTTLSLLYHWGIRAGRIGSASLLSKALSQLGLLGKAPLPTPRQTLLLSRSLSWLPLLKNAPLHMKKMTNKGGTTAMAVLATARNLYSKGKNGGRTVKDSGITNPTKQKQRTGNDDILGAALESRKQMPMTKRQGLVLPVTMNDNQSSRFPTSRVTTVPCRSPSQVRFCFVGHLW